MKSKEDVGKDEFEGLLAENKGVNGESEVCSDCSCGEYCCCCERKSAETRLDPATFRVAPSSKDTPGVLDEPEPMCVSSSGPLNGLRRRFRLRSCIGGRGKSPTDASS